MDILDNATIVRNLSDPTLWGNVWSMAKGLIGMVDFMEGIKRIEDKHHTYTFSDEDSYYNYLHFLESFSKQWSESLDLLNLEDLYRWLINDSTDIAQLEFRLKQIKCRTGKMWNEDEANQLHTDLLHITDRLTDVIVGLKDNAFMCMYDLEAVETDARHSAIYIRKFVCKWLRDVLAIQDRMKKIIQGAEQILNPQPTQTETEQQDPIFSNWDLFKNAWVVDVFQDLIKEDIISIDKGYFRWQWDRSLLLWFCKQISDYCGLTKEKKGKQQVDWVAFDERFICKIWGKW